MIMFGLCLTMGNMLIIIKVVKELKKINSMAILTWYNWPNMVKRGRME
jgi:hypothetical protein